MRIPRSLLAAAVGGTLLLGGVLSLRPRAMTATVDAGPVGERIVARAVVEPSAGVRHVFAAADARIVRVLVSEGERVESGQSLAELDVAGHAQPLASPQRGVVLARHCDAGDYALAVEHGAGLPLFELADPTQTELRVEIEEADAASVAVNQPVLITPVAGQPTSIHGQVTRVSARLQRRSIGADDARVRADGLVRVAHVAWRGEPATWPLGARAEAIIEVRRHAAAARVPRAALSVRDGRSVVEQPHWLWAHEIPVKIVTSDDAYAEVTGVAPGTKVVIAAPANE